MDKDSIFLEAAENPIYQGVRPIYGTFEEKDDDDEAEDIEPAGGTDENDIPDEAYGIEMKEDEEDVEEGEVPNMICAPCRPSQEMVDRHNLTHIPFRNWCPICVKAKGRDLQHRSDPDKDRSHGEYNVDYCFFGVL